MPTLDHVVEVAIPESGRTKQLRALFDVPPMEKARLEWHVEMRIEERDWKVGLVVGPSGCGKTQIARQLWPEELAVSPSWTDRPVIDDFPTSMSVSEVSKICGAVGFNTIPAWLRPFRVLSNGEQFRVELARRLCEAEGLCVVDEFSSVVDRQVARIAAHAVQKYVRRRDDLRFVAVSCHSDIIDWLQPDWIYQPAECNFAWRDLQRRPELECVISPVARSAWALFAPYHYLTASLHRSARCFGLWVGDELAAFAAVLPRPVKQGYAIYGLSRVVCLPDYQGLGLGGVLIETLGALYVSLGRRFRNYPSHSAFIAACARSSTWRMVKRPGMRSSRNARGTTSGGPWGTRPCAIFEYVGPAMDPQEAERIMGYWTRRR